MASKELIRAVKSYEEYREKRGIDDDFINAYLQASQAALITEQDKEYGLGLTGNLKRYISDYIREQTEGGTFWQLERYGQEHQVEYALVNMMFETYKLESYHLFESYMYYMERDRKYEKRFYVPRRNTFGVVVSDLQDMEDDLLDVYGLSLPSRTGKTTIMDFFATWIGMRHPDSHNAYGGHSGQLAKRFFKGLSNIIETPDYRFSELFFFFNPKLKKVVESKSSDPAEYTINLGKPDEFATYTCRGIDGTWTGAIDVSSNGYLFVDDLVRDREHSLSPSRMENTYQEYQNKMLDRLNDGAKKILVGTLWSTNDPLMREEKLNEDNPRARFRKIPALDDNDKSNFDFEVKGFSSEYYIDMRNRLDKAEWMAKFQQRPFVREGLTFPIEELNYFDGTLPDGKCRTVAIVDCAFGGGDSLSMPIGKEFDDKRVFICGWVFDKRSPEFTVPRIVDAIIECDVSLLWIEKNSGGQFIAEKIQKELENRGIYGVKIELYSAPVRMHKEEKIVAYSGYVRSNFYFLRSTKHVESEIEMYVANEDYRKAMDEVTTWSAEGKKQHDDAPDSISSLAMKLENRIRNRKASVSRSWI